MLKSKKTPISSYFKPMLFHRKPLEIIDFLKKSMKGTLDKNKTALSKINAELSFTNKDFRCSFTLKRPSVFSDLVGNEIKKVEFDNNINSYIIESIFLTGTDMDGNFEGSIAAFHTKGFTKKKQYYHRIVIPIEKEIQFHFTIEDCTFQSDLGYYSRTGVKANISGDVIYANVIHSGKPKKFFLSIESNRKQSFDEFSEKAFAVQKSIGYLCGHLAGNEGYFFSYSRKKMRNPTHHGFHNLRSSIKTIYTPIYSNPYGYLRGNSKIAEKYYQNDMLKPVSMECFDLLCQKLYDSLEFSSAVLLILESCRASLLFMPGGFAIALENLSDLIIGDDKNNLAPMSKPISRKVRKECSEILHKYKGDISPNNLEVLLGRINQINQTTNKARLRAPFTKLGIALVDEDLKVLESRNDFLHGRVPDFTKEGEPRSLDRINKDLYYASMRFYTLLNLLILKWIGFDNYILNHPKIREAQCGIKLAEKHYRSLTD